MSEKKAFEFWNEIAFQTNWKITFRWTNCTKKKSILSWSLLLLLHWNRCYSMDFPQNEKLCICTVLINSVKIGCILFSVITFFHIVPPLRSQRMQACWTLVDGKWARVSVNGWLMNPDSKCDGYSILLFQYLSPSLHLSVLSVCIIIS